MLRDLWRTLSPLQRCFMVFILFFQHGQHEKAFTIIESTLGMKQGDP
jgi:hypothetical protein